MLTPERQNSFTTSLDIVLGSFSHPVDFYPSTACLLCVSVSLWFSCFPAEASLVDLPCKNEVVRACRTVKI